MYQIVRLLSVQFNSKSTQGTIVSPMICGSGFSLELQRHLRIVADFGPVLSSPCRRGGSVTLELITSANHSQQKHASYLGAYAR